MSYHIKIYDKLPWRNWSCYATCREEHEYCPITGEIGFDEDGDLYICDHIFLTSTSKGRQVKVLFYNDKNKIIDRVIIDDVELDHTEQAKKYKPIFEQKLAKFVFQIEQNKVAKALNKLEKMK